MDFSSVYKTLQVGEKSYAYFSLQAAEKAGLQGISRLPYSLKVLLENLLRHRHTRAVTEDDLQALAQWVQNPKAGPEIAFHPSRVLMQDFTGVPAVVDLATMRQAMRDRGGDPKKINPLTPVDLVIDHSVMVDRFGTTGAFDYNVEKEFERNYERYAFLRWGQKAFDNFRVVPPGTGICHQVNIEYLSKVVWTSKNPQGDLVAYPDTLVGTDSHTTMANGLGVLGWGVGGIEAEAVMLGQPISMLIPEVIGFQLTGELREGATATDLVLRVTEMLRQRGVVGKFVEFYGDGLKNLDLANRATIANMSPEFGATCGIFPIDEETLHYLRLTHRPADQIALVEAYAKEQGLWRTDMKDTVYTDTLSLDLTTVEPSLAGPKRPQDRILLSHMKAAFDGDTPPKVKKAVPVAGHDFQLHDGDVVIAAITSCTNTSNPSVMIGAGLLAKRAVEVGLQVKPWVKTSLAPGSTVVSAYLEKAGLQTYLDKLGFNLVGYGCTTCIGNSGPLSAEIDQAIADGDLTVAAVLSGNRNFEGRINPSTKNNYLASPLLVVAYALAGTVRIDLHAEPLGTKGEGRPIYLKDIWPSNGDIQRAVAAALNPQMFEKGYSNVFDGGETWKNIPISGALTYDWQDKSTYVKHPPFFENLGDAQQTDITPARILALLGDSVTTDHISPAGSIKKGGPAALYLESHGIGAEDYNSYGARRGNHEVMMRGTFANPRIRNELVPDITGGMTRHLPSGDILPIYDAAMRYQEDKTPLVVIAGKEYGTGSSRDWAAKGTRLLGVRAVLAESFERIHRSNLIGMGVLPLVFKGGATRKTLHLDGTETVTLRGIETLTPGKEVTATFTRSNGETFAVPLTCRIDTGDELRYYNSGGILHYVLGNILNDHTNAA